MQTVKQPDILDIHEIATQQQLGILSAAMQQIAMLVGQAFPMLGQQVHAIAQNVDRQLREADNQVSGLILRGHGPRTVAKLRLAADDEERARIREQLPYRYEEGALPHRISLMVSSRLGDNTPVLKAGDETRVFVGSNEIPELEKITYAKTVQEYFKDLAEGKEIPRSGFFSGAPEHCNWNQSLILKVEYSNLVLISPNPKAAIRLYTYVAAEDAWVEHDDYNYIHPTAVESSFKAMLHEKAIGTLSVKPIPIADVARDARQYLQEVSETVELPVIAGEDNLSNPDNWRGSDGVVIVRPAYEPESPARHVVLRTERKGLQMTLHYGRDEQEPDWMTVNYSPPTPTGGMPMTWDSFTPIAQRQLRRIFIDAIYNTVQRQKALH